MTEANREHQVQKSIVAYLRLVLPPDQRVVGISNNPRNRLVGALEKARGMAKGFPDLILLGRVTGLIEVKTKGRGLRPEQMEWAEFCYATGMNHAVVRSIDDVREVLCNWGVKTRETAKLTGEKIPAD